MNAAPRPIQTIFSSAVATIIALSMLWSVVALFQSRGRPLDHAAAAEPACASKAYLSERERRACVQKPMAEAVTPDRRTAAR